MPLALQLNVAEDVRFSDVLKCCACHLMQVLHEALHRGVQKLIIITVIAVSPATLFEIEAGRIYRLCAHFCCTGEIELMSA